MFLFFLSIISIQGLVPFLLLLLSQIKFLIKRFELEPANKFRILNYTLVKSVLSSIYLKNRTAFFNLLVTRSIIYINFKPWPLMNNHKIKNEKSNKLFIVSQFHFFFIHENKFYLYSFHIKPYNMTYTVLKILRYEAHYWRLKIISYPNNNNKKTTFYI